MGYQYWYWWVQANLSRHYTQHCNDNNWTHNKLQTKQRHPYLALSGKLRGASCKHFGINRARVVTASHYSIHISTRAAYYLTSDVNSTRLRTLLFFFFFFLGGGGSNPTQLLSIVKLLVRKHQNSASLVFVTGDRWIPHTKVQQRGKCFHLMTSSWLRVLVPNSCMAYLTHLPMDKIATIWLTIFWDTFSWMKTLYFD